MMTMDFDTAWCPVCDKQIAPKRTVALKQTMTMVNEQSRRRAPLPQVKRTTIIDQGPYPLYCSDECKMADLRNQREDTHAPLTYQIYHSSSRQHPRAPESTEGSGSSPSDVESDSLSSASTRNGSYPSTSQVHPTASSSTRFHLQPKPRSRSFLTGRSLHSSDSRHTPSSLPITSTLSSTFGDRESTSISPNSDHHLISQFSDCFSRRSESRVSLYSGPSSPTSRSPPSISALSTSPRRERPLLAHGAEGKLLVPDVSVRVPSRPTTSRRESSSSLASTVSSASSTPGGLTSRHRTGSMASVASSRHSLKSPLARYGSDLGDDEKDRLDLSEDDEYPFEDSDVPLSPAFGGFGMSTSPKRPLVGDMRAWSFDAYSNPNSVSDSRKERRRSEKKEDRKSYNPDGKKLFLFPTDY